jgi:hypothetical protein
MLSSSSSVCVLHTRSLLQEHQHGSFRGCNNNWWQKERRGRLVRHYYTIHLNALSKNRPAPPQGPKHTHTQKEKNDATFENIRSICSPPMDTVVEALGVVSATVSDTDPWKWPFLKIYIHEQQRRGGTRSSQDNNRQREKISNKIKKISTEKKVISLMSTEKKKKKHLRG